MGKSFSRKIENQVIQSIWNIWGEMRNVGDLGTEAQTSLVPWLHMLYENSPWRQKTGTKTKLSAVDMLIVIWTMRLCFLICLFRFLLPVNLLIHTSPQLDHWWLNHPELTYTCHSFNTPLLVSTSRSLVMPGIFPETALPPASRLSVTMFLHSQKKLKYLSLRSL